MKVRQLHAIKGNFSKASYLQYLINFLNSGQRLAGSTASAGHLRRAPPVHDSTTDISVSSSNKRNP